MPDFILFMLAVMVIAGFVSGDFGEAAKESAYKE